MSHKRAVHTDNAPKPIGTYSQGIIVPKGVTVYLSGQIAINPKTGKTVTDTFEHETEQVFNNMKAVAEAAGGTMDDIVKVTIFITDFKNFPTVNSVMAKYFNKPYPARSTVGVASIAKEVDVEIEAIMVIPENKE